MAASDYSPTDTKPEAGEAELSLANGGPYETIDALQADSDYGHAGDVRSRGICGCFGRLGSRQASQTDLAHENCHLSPCPDTAAKKQHKSGMIFNSYFDKFIDLTPWISLYSIAIMLLQTLLATSQADGKVRIMRKKCIHIGYALYLVLHALNLCFFFNVHSSFLHAVYIGVGAWMCLSACACAVVWPEWLFSS